jgi:hypothetical protein
MFKKVFLLIVSIFQSIILFAQNQPTEVVEMADTMRSNGKIYVVVLVLGVILAGIIVYLIKIDSKVSKIEKSLKS